jgi:hypothetical protein
LLFQKPARSITGVNIVAVIRGFVNPSSYIGWKNCRKNAGGVGVSQAETAEPSADETKEARQRRACLTNICFDQFYFASFAI